jgi:hypothetical protein
MIDAESSLKVCERLVEICEDNLENELSFSS